MSSAGGEGSSPSRKGKEREEDGAAVGTGHREKGAELCEGDVDLGDLHGAAAGWVEARTSCPHLGMPAVSADDLARVPPPDSPCSRCHHPAENWLCLICKDVLCSRFINKHMLFHYQEAGHCLALSFRNAGKGCVQKTQVVGSFLGPCASGSYVHQAALLLPLLRTTYHTKATRSGDLSVWCFACDSYLDVQAITELRPVYEVAHLLKFGERPPFRSLDILDLSGGQNGSSSSRT